MMLDYEALAARAFDIPPRMDDWQALRVWGDTLEAAGDPRGVLIALEHAMRAQPERRHKLLEAQREHELAHADALLGPLARLAHPRRGLTLEWRAGQLYGAALDTRDLKELVGLGPAQAVGALLAAPITAELRRLYVRVPNILDVNAVTKRLLAGPSRPIEELCVVSTPGELASVSLAGLRKSPAGDLAAQFPDLRLWGEYTLLTTLLLPLHGKDNALTARLIAGADPETAVGRMILGRALVGRPPTADDERLLSRPVPNLPAPRVVDAIVQSAERHALALDRIAALGERAAFLVDTLMAMIAVRSPMTLDLARLIERLAQLGGHARRALPVLLKTSRRSESPPAVQRAAQDAIAHLEASWPV